MLTRKPLRLRGFDYSQPGGYFVTICTASRAKILADLAGPDRRAPDPLVTPELRLTWLGEIARERWMAIPAHYRGVELDLFTILPDHVHGIVLLQTAGVPLGVVVGSFKASVARLSAPTRVGQRGYHDHIIRNDAELQAYREYISTNAIRHAFGL